MLHIYFSVHSLHMRRNAEDKISRYSVKINNIKFDRCAIKMCNACVVLKYKEFQNFGCCSICLQIHDPMKEKNDHLLQFMIT